MLIVHDGLPEASCTNELVRDAYPLTMTVIVEVKVVPEYVTIAAALFSVIDEEVKVEEEIVTGNPLNVMVSVVKFEEEIVAEEVPESVIDDVSKEDKMEFITPLTVIVELCINDPGEKVICVPL